MQTVTARQLMALAGLGSVLLLAGAFAFQLAGYEPCELCILQRWPHVVAAAIALAVWLMRDRLPGGVRLWAALGAVTMLFCAALAFFHAGVEWKWWAGPTTCSGGAASIAGLSVDDLIQRIEDAPIVRCDAPALLIFGLSMALWNAIFSLGLAGVWTAAAAAARR